MCRKEDKKKLNQRKSHDAHAPLTPPLFLWYFTRVKLPKINEIKQHEVTSTLVGLTRRVTILVNFILTSFPSFSKPAVCGSLH